MKENQKTKIKEQKEKQISGFSFFLIYNNYIKSDFKFALPGQTGVGAKPEPTFQKPPPSINSGFGQDFNNFGGLSKKNDFGDFANFGFGQNAQPSNQFAGQPSAGNQNQIPSNFNFGGPSFPGNNQQQNKAPVKQSDNLLDL